jgi:hypothetical protein
MNATFTRLYTIINVVILIAFSHDLSAQQGHVIHLSEDPVIVDGDALYSFNYGYAVVQKGSSYCLINAEGRVVIPYNKYNYYYNPAITDRGNDSEIIFYEGMPVDKFGFINGGLPVQDPTTKLWGMLNDKLQLLIPCKYDNISPPGDDGYIRGGTKGINFAMGTRILFDKNGKIVLTGPNANNHVGLSPMEGTRNKFGYLNASKDLKVPYQFEEAMPFSDGLAAVANKDQFIIKWGFINSMGKLVIPYIFTKQPSDFHEGLAFVEPAVKDEFNYAYINKKGSVVIKVTQAPDEWFNPSPVYLIYHTNAHRPYASFLNGYSVWRKEFRATNIHSGLGLMDTTGIFTPYIDLLRNNGWPLNSYMTQSEFVNHEVRISSRSGVKYDEIYAIANDKGQIIITTTYKEGTVLGMIYSLFDPVSGLVKVMEYDSKRTINGYCDRSGEIKIILGAPPKW